MFKKSFVIFTLLVVWLSAMPVFAGDETKSLRVNNPQVGIVLDVKDDKYFVTSSPNTWKNFYSTTYNLSKATVEFGLDETQKLNHAAFSSTITFNVAYFDKNGIQANVFTSSGLTPAGVATNQTLSINYDPASGTSYQGKSIWKMDDQYWMQVKIINIVTKQGTSVIPNPLDLYFEASISTERYYNLATWSSAQLGNVNNRMITASNELEIYWPYVQGAEEYELEWCWDESTSYDFRNRSTRVVTSDNYYRIPLMYEAGAISYRIRPIGRTGADFTLRQEGKWTNEVMGAPESGGLSLLNHPTGKFYKLGLSEYQNGLLNWSGNFTYDENGKKGYGASYMDGLLMQHESVAKLNTENKIITQATLYDYQGRPAVSVLPSPLEQQGVLFVPQLNKYNNGSSLVNFDKSIFDIDGTSCSAPVSPPISNASAGSSGYYSPVINSMHSDRDEQQQYLPDAEEFPYVRIEYTPDLTGRVRAQTLPGSTHKIGSDKETKFYYGNPTQQELDRLFGSEVGYASHYTKNAVKDANGQLSVNYVDMYGRTIATALTGNKPTQLGALESYDAINLINVTLTDDLIIKNKKDLNNYLFEVNSSIFVDKDNDQQTINYGFTAANFRDACMESKGICFDCIYELELSIKDECGNDLINTSNDPATPVPGSLNLILGTPTIDKTCDVPGYQFSLSTISGNVVFPKVGTYFINKKLKVSDIPVEQYWEFYSKQESFLNSTCVKSIWEFLSEAIGNVDFSSCNFTCEQCIASLNTYAAQNNIPTSSPTYTALLKECQENCNNNNDTYNDPCESYREQMMNDLTPTSDWVNLPYDNGQYVDVTYSGGVPAAVSFGGYSKNSYLSFTYYEDDMTTVSMVKDGNGIFKTANNLLPNEFIENFKPSWAKSVLSRHPEYCYLTFCENNKASDIYDQAMLSCQTFDEACAKGFLKPISLSGLTSSCGFSGSGGVCLSSCSSSTLDPFFVANPSLATSMQAEFSSYNSQYPYNTPNTISSSISNLLPGGGTINQGFPGKCIYDLAYYIVSGGGTANCYSSTNSNYICEKDRLWQTFRGLYLSKKRRIMEEARNAYAVSSGCYNACIGIANNSTNPAYTTTYTGSQNTSSGVVCNSTTSGFYANKQRVFANYSDIYIYGPQYNVSTSGGVPSTSNGNTPNYNTNVIISLPEKYFQTCTAYADEWMKKLKDCPNLANSSINPTLWNNIRTDLIAVCAYGSNTDNPLGVSAIASPSPSTVPPFVNSYYTTGSQNASAVPFVTTGTQFASLYYNPTNPSVKHFNSFEEVLKSYLGATAVNALCNAELIQFPGPQHTPFSPNGPKPYNILDTCACNDILQNDAKFLQLQSAGQLPAGVTTPTQLFLKERNISLDNYLQLLCACKNANPNWSTSNQGWTGTQATSVQSLNLFVPPGLSCCLLCTRNSDDPWDGALTSFGTYYQNLTGNTFNGVSSPLTSYPWPFPSLFTNYMNNLFGYNVTFDDYITFFNGCNQCIVQRYSNSNEVNANAVSLMNYLNTRITNKTLLSTDTITYFNDPYFFASRLYDKGVPVTAKISYSTTTAGDSLKIRFNYSDTITAFNREVILHLPGDSSYTFETLTGFDDIQLVIDTGIPGDVYKFRLATTGFDSNGMPGIVYFNGRTNDLPLNEDNIYNGRGSSTASTATCAVLCNKTTYPIEQNECITTIMHQIVTNAQNLYAQYLKEEKDKFIKKYKDACMGVTEIFNRTYRLHEHHYTLYYYDQAGNLTRTVPPKGVNPLSSSTDLNKALLSHAEPVGGPNEIFPPHDYVSNYKQTTFNNTAGSVSPDEDAENFYIYDYLGRIVASSNAKQRAAAGTSTYIWSYTIYDKFGRISEVGEVNDPSLNFFYVFGQAMVQSPSNWGTIVGGKPRTNVTKTFYDQSINTIVEGYFNYNQQNLRNRVSSVVYQANGSSATYDYATHFSYDEQGNVKLMVQENPKLENLGQNVKYIAYDYDLFSGSVNLITYQPGEPDQYKHKYIYDADNRLHEVFTSRDGINWERDAKYFYYQHGALARTELGEKQVNGIDFAYTIHGWIKGINSDVLDPSIDMGKDGGTNIYSNLQSELHSNFAKDAMAYSLNYYFNNGTGSPDYKPIISTSNFLSDKTALTSSGNFNLNSDAADLFNGNISSMVTTYMNFDPTSTRPLNAAAPQITGYKYDQLHRLTLMKSFRDLVINSGSSGFNAWNAASGANYDNAYTTQLVYDANGNIINLGRNGSTTNIHSGSSGLAMDDLTYSYSQHAGYNNNRKTNRLIGVHDGITNTAYTDDIEDQGIAISNDATKGSWNYDYDEIGNIIRDNSEQITSIEWTPDRKVKRILRSQNPKMVGSTPTYPAELEFDYDANRQRVLKIVKPRYKNTVTNKGETKPQGDWLYTYYVRDATGQVMAVYDMHYELVTPGSPATYKQVYKVTEYDMYGSSRLGTDTKDYTITSANFTANFDANGNFVYVNPATGPKIPKITTGPIGLNPNAEEYPDVYGNKAYELSNHLGNVIATISDRKTNISSTTVSKVIDFETGNHPYTTKFQGSVSPQNVQQVDNSTSPFSSGFRFMVTPGAQINASVYAKTGTTAAGFLVVAFVDKVTNTMLSWNVVALGTANYYALNNNVQTVPNNVNPIEAQILVHNPSNTVVYIDDLAYTLTAPSGQSYVTQYLPDVQSHNDYYPFGQTMPGRTWVGSDYRYTGVNGQEKEPEIFAGASSAEFWMYDSRLGRRWEMDPIVKEWESPYATFSGNPIYFSDPEGLDSKDPKEQKGAEQKGTTYSKDNNARGIGNTQQSFNEDCKCYIDNNIAEMTDTKVNQPTENAAVANIDNSERAIQRPYDISHPDPNYKPTPQQKAWYSLSDNFPIIAGVTVITPFVAEPLAAAAVEELAGVPIWTTLGGGIIKSTVKRGEKEIVKRAFKTNNINTFKGASADEVKDFLSTQGWEIISAKKGKPGFRAINPTNSNDVITVVQGNAEKLMKGTNIPKVKQGDYLKRSNVKVNGEDVRIPLEGNPALND